VELHVTTQGTQLRKRGECFQVSCGSDRSEWSARKVKRIIVAPHVFLTSDVVELAIENNVDIVFIRWNGEPLARLWHPGHGSTAAIRRAQLLVAAETVEAVSLVKSWAIEKLGNQEAFLRELARNKRGDGRFLVDGADGIRESGKRVEELLGEMEEVRPALMGHEGQGSKLYFKALSATLPREFQFQERSRRPARDPFNAALNYGYGMLYSRIERSLILAGLDPYLGFLHVDRYNKPSLVFDFIEPFRIWVDRPITRLFTTRKIAKKEFTSSTGGLALEKTAKQKIVESVNGFLEDSISHEGRKRKRGNVIQARAHALAMQIMKGEVCSSGPSTTSPITTVAASSPGF